MTLRDRWGEPFEGTKAELRAHNDREAKRRKRALKRRVELHLDQGIAAALDRVLQRYDMPVQDLFGLFVLKLDATDELMRFPGHKIDIDKYAHRLGYEHDPQEGASDEHPNDC